MTLFWSISRILQKQKTKCPREMFKKISEKPKMLVFPKITIDMCLFAFFAQSFYMFYYLFIDLSHFFQQILLHISEK